jgi:FkbM family methyltransferase
MDLLHRFAQAPKPLWLRLILRRIVLLVLPKTIRFYGYQFVVNREDHIMGSALLRGRYEPYGTRLFVESLSPGMVVVDCGANIGIYTCLASGAIGSEGKVYAFEPEPRNFSCLSETVRVNRLENVQTERLALSDVNEEASLFLSDMNMGDHRLGKTDEKRESVRIQTCTLDSYWKGIIPEINVLKMDVQGAEGLVLKGMSQTILQSPKLKIFMEFWPQALRSCGTDPKEVLQSLVAFGFSIQIIDQDNNRLRTLDNPDQLLVTEQTDISFDLYLERRSPSR